MKIDSQALKQWLAPTGRLRAAINLGNPILANRRDAGEPFGVSVDMARELANRLAVPVDFLVVDAAGKAVQAVRDGNADIGFFAIDPLRGEGIAFTAAYLLIEGCYMVRQNSPILFNEEVDRPGVTVTVGQNSAYDLFLTRHLKQATLVRSATSQAVVDTFVAQQLNVAAGVKQQLEADMKRHPGHRLLEGNFMTIQQAMGLPKSRGEGAQAYLVAFVEDLKRSGFVADAMRRHGIEGATVAPLV